jgi:hypothetical protein
VVESAGFNDKTWLDLTGHPHSEELRVTERFTRRDFGHMQLQMTIDDPRAYARSFTVSVDLQFVGDTELLEEVCNENERDSARTAGAKMPAITLPSRVLSTFSGTYEVLSGGGANIEFVKDAEGVVTQLTFRSVEGEARAVRKSK